MFKFNKYLLFISITIIIVLAISFWTIISKGYDRQNRLILFLKKIVPTQISRTIRDTIFFIPNLQNRNEFLENQVEKYEQGLNGKLFKKRLVYSSDDKKFEVREFFLPFPRLDTRLGWAATENSKRAHYFEIVKDKVLVISGLGQTIFFEKKNLDNKQLNQINISNNLEDYLKKNDLKLIGIRDLLVDDGFVYISLIHRDNKGITINVYKASLNFDKLNFTKFFQTNEYWKDYNVFSGGRLEKYKDDKILFSIGYSGIDSVAQNKESLLGKIISIDKKTSKYKLVSIGHRNPQGLYYVDSKDIVINSEHGPKGGDEINLNFQNYIEPPNYGWDIASYGSPYSGDDFFKKSHKEYGFVEPFVNYTPSIGISEIINLSEDKNFYSSNNTIFASSLRAGSIYIIETDKKMENILNEDRIFFKEQRIRDLEFDEELKILLVLFEKTPSIGVIKYLN